jgi:hypothetical protein
VSPWLFLLILLTVNHEVEIELCPELSIWTESFAILDVKTHLQGMGNTGSLDIAPHLSLTPRRV